MEDDLYDSLDADPGKRARVQDFIKQHQVAPARKNARRVVVKLAHGDPEKHTEPDDPSAKPSHAQSDDEFTEPRREPSPVRSVVAKSAHNAHDEFTEPRRDPSPARRVVAKPAREDEPRRVAAHKPATESEPESEDEGKNSRREGSRRRRSPRRRRRKRRCSASPARAPRRRERRGHVACVFSRTLAAYFTKVLSLTEVNPAWHAPEGLAEYMKTFADTTKVFLMRPTDQHIIHLERAGYEMHYLK